MAGEQHTQEVHDFFQRIGMDAARGRIALIDRRVDRLQHKHTGTYRTSKRDSDHAPQQRQRKQQQQQQSSAPGRVELMTRCSGGCQALVVQHESALPVARKSREEFDEAKRNLAEGRWKLRDKLLNQWRQQHEVVAHTRPSDGVPEVCRCNALDVRWNNFDVYRRPHQHLVIGSDEREMRKMPVHDLCMTENLKRVITKMRANTFQRRLKLDIYEKTLSEVDEIRRRGMRRQAPRRSLRSASPSATMQVAERLAGAGREEGRGERRLPSGRFEATAAGSGQTRHELDASPAPSPALEAVAAVTI
eukprot:NODE_12245_length_1236_cov_13.982867.p1 GENE.NODE_12245_length_1236_cov_13.982867~~NODE_12245_length_1236_cov_13.982867.p1  ORF type:complete len:304 (-),score=46.40 NODE_12245_length_1236_cov_13.982867:202-1113(-)